MSAERKVKSIYFAGLVTDSNLGDAVILESTEWLYKEALGNRDDISFSRLDLHYAKPQPILRIWRKVKRTLIKIVKLNSIRFEIDKLKKQYRLQLSEAGLIVVVGGGVVKYKYQSFFLYLTALIEVAEELNVPVVVNAAGVEGYSEDDHRCQILKSSLNKSVVKSITTRDDFDLLSVKYLNNRTDLHIAKVADPAVYCNEVYSQRKHPSEVYGIGLIRGEIFKDNERQVTPEKLADFYVDLILGLEKRGYKYQLFTNGLPADLDLIPIIEGKLSCKKLNVIVPRNTNELINTISRFSTVIAARLHANIISYALNVPSIGLVWNDKLRLFGQDIGYPERFFEYDKLDANKVIECSALANKEGYDNDLWSKYKATAKSNISIIVEKWLAGNL